VIAVVPRSLELGKRPSVFAIGSANWRPRPLVHGQCPGDRPRLCRGGEPVRIPLDDERVGREREPEVPRLSLPDLPGLCVLRNEAAERERLARAEPRKRPRHGDRSSDPGRHDEVAEPDDDPCEETNHPLTNHVSRYPPCGFRQTG
jgi:hypothetical protein